MVQKSKLNTNDYGTEHILDCTLTRTPKLNLLSCLHLELAARNKKMQVYYIKG